MQSLNLAIILALILSILHSLNLSFGINCQLVFSEISINNAI